MKGYVWWVVTPHVMITLVGSQLVKAALLAVTYGMSTTLAVVRSRATCCRPLAAGTAGLVLGSAGISFCCSPLVGLIGVLGLAPVVTKLWGVSMGLLIVTVTVLVLTTKLRPEEVAPMTERMAETRAGCG